MSVCVLAYAGLPYVFLITDGSVPDEREICRQLAWCTAQPPAAKGMAPRVSTFGIGRFCNHFFLKQLATTGVQLGKPATSK